MKTSDYDYQLPEELIAQTPLENRSSSRLMRVNKKKNTIEHGHFDEIVDFLEKGDVLCLNNSRVFKARLIGEKEDTHAKIEVLILDMKDNICKSLSKPARRVKVGTKIIFGGGLLTATCIKTAEEGVIFYKMEYKGIFYEVLDQLGTMPLPPYITEKLKDSERYQTVYSKIIGSAAAPTAGLHFTNEILDRIRKKGVEILFVTLHVGLGTFRPVEVEDVTKHKMHSEFYQMSDETAEALNKAKQEGRRIVAVGTTTCRVLESNFREGAFHAEESNTDIFIYEGYSFKAMNALITNFHLPKSTLLMLVSAFSSRDLMLRAYHTAVEERYRFFSFGDAMLIYE